MLYYVSNTVDKKYRHNIGETTNVHCPICNKNMSILFNYDISDKCVDWCNWNDDFVPLIYCFSCDMWNVTYGDNNAQIVILNYDGIEDEFKGITQKTVGVSLKAMDTPGERPENIDARWYTKEFGHSVVQPFPHFGHPYNIIGGLHEVRCVKCNGVMEFKAALYDTSQLKFDLLGNLSQIVFHYCKGCSSINAVIHQG
jgi:hypothetical protein